MASTPKAGILGLGEVGSAIKTLVSNHYPVFARDLDFDEISTNSIDYLHIAIPYTKNFNKIVTHTIQELKPKLTLIHTTTKPGSSHYIHNKTKLPLVHAPFVGTHPHTKPAEFAHPKSLPPMISYLQKYPQIIGPTNKKSLTLVKRYYHSLKLKLQVFDNSTTSELAKLLSTTYYAWNIIYQKWTHQLCQQHQIDFDQVYTQFNQLYNQIYQSQLPHVTRPVLKHHPGPVGGHCLIPNAKILHNWSDSDFTQFLLEQNQKLSR